MKQIVFFLLILAHALCAQIDSLGQVLNSHEDFLTAAELFHEGKVETGEIFYAGLLEEIVFIDVKYREMEEEDNMDASAETINESLDECLEAIEHLRASLTHYSVERWPRQQEFSELSLEWIKGIEDMVNNFARPLATAMAKPDEDWTDEEYTLYEEWQAAYNTFLEIDERWVAFQYTFAEANEFMLADETIDIESLVTTKSNDNGKDDPVQTLKLIEPFLTGKSQSVNDFYDAYSLLILNIYLSYQQLIEMDNANLNNNEITSWLDDISELIQQVHDVLDLYRSSGWQQSTEFIEVNQSWLEEFDKLLKTKVKPLTKVMSRPVQTCTKKELKKYAQWQEADNLLTETGKKVTAIQFVFAAANGIEISTTIDTKDF